MGACEAVVASGQYVLGAQGEAFEVAFAAYCGVAHCAGVANGTEALELAVTAAGCGAGDDIVTVANAGGYASAAILHAGATPVYADIDPLSFVMTAEHFLQARTAATKAVIVTHLYGLMADMPAICEAAGRYGITVIEDCAQAHGASRDGRKAGSWGAMGCFSFYPTKNLGALGDAGCVVTRDAPLAARIKSLRQHGWGEKYIVPREVGRNSRMDELQAALLLRMLPYLDRWNEVRRNIARRYREAGITGVRFQQVGREEGYVAHLCVAFSERREEIMAGLQRAQIGAAVHYPVADYAQPGFRKRMGDVAPLPHTEQALGGIFSLPCFPEMTDDDIEQVIRVLQHHGQAL